ncbi:MAG: SpoIID/LytB domain-containing protein [Bacteroidales bacterium]
MNKQPKIRVGIMFSEEISFYLHGDFSTEQGKVFVPGQYKILKKQKDILLENHNGEQTKIEIPFTLTPTKYDESFFELNNVTIGINFHWERKENQQFKGDLEIIEEEGHLTAINVLALEDYLESVISSEMSARSSEGLLKAHAVISRSWLLAQTEKGKLLQKQGKQHQGVKTEDEFIQWYDREDHQNFDVCADDHCQRYQGITKASTNEVANSVRETFGQVLAYGENICDARYSKCCGGIAETFENVWEPVPHPYLTKVIDNPDTPEGFDTTLDTEQKAQHWIRGNPSAFCNTHDKKVLQQVLNDYDQETTDFFRWKTVLSQEDIQRLLSSRLNISVGKILDLIPIERGVSGRLIKLKIVGSEKSITIGKELVIRKAFSKTHLYSSAFVTDKTEIKDGVPGKFIFTGAGWGHGVGLCQIGAAVMGNNGYSYKEILMHYFKGAQLKQWYSADSE